MSSSQEEEQISVSTAAVTVVGTGHHMFNVEHYSWLKATHSGKNGSCVESSVFNVGGHVWKLRCFLNGQSKEDAGFVSLYLCLCDAAPGTVVHAGFQFALVPHRHRGWGRLLQMLRPPSYGATAMGVFHKDGAGGARRFISVEELEHSMFLRYDCFAVRCTVTVVEDRPCVMKEAVVRTQDVQRMGLLCKCNDSMCRRHHATIADLREDFGSMCRSIFG